MHGLVTVVRTDIPFDREDGGPVQCGRSGGGFEKLHPDQVIFAASKARFGAPANGRQLKRQEVADGQFCGIIETGGGVDRNVDVAGHGVG